MNAVDKERVDNLYQFVLAGGRLTFGEWLTLTDEDRKVICKAAKDKTDGEALLIARLVATLLGHVQSQAPKKEGALEEETCRELLGDPKGSAAA